MIRVKKFVFNIFGENCYVADDGSGECVIIDPGCLTAQEKDEVDGFLASNGLRPVMILLTHAHSDHIFGVRHLEDRYGIRAVMDRAEESSIKVFNPRMTALGLPSPEEFGYDGVRGGDILHFGNTDIKVLSTPGHSPGGLCFLFEDDRAVFTGDTLFAGSIGRTDSDCASLDDLMESIFRSLMTLDGDIKVYPGHGPVSDIARERTTNPFIFERDE